MKWHDCVLSVFLVLAIIFVFLRMELHSKWLVSHGEYILEIQEDIKMVFEETTYNRLKHKSLEFEIQRVLQQNEAFKEAYYLIKEELNETKIQKRKRD